MAAAISRFTGGNGFLSNFWVEPVAYNGHVYASAEHAFQAAKATNPKDHDWVAGAYKPGGAKWRGKRVAYRPDWDAVRIGVMRDVIACKFAPGTGLASRLEATGDAQLTEGNGWDDTFWGVCRGVGENWLGRILMEQRAANRRIAAGA